MYIKYTYKCQNILVMKPNTESIQKNIISEYYRAKNQKDNLLEIHDFYENEIQLNRRRMLVSLSMVLFLVLITTTIFCFKELIPELQYLFGIILTSLFLVLISTYNLFREYISCKKELNRTMYFIGKSKKSSFQLKTIEKEFTDKKNNY